MASEHMLAALLLSALLLPSHRQAALGYATGQDITLCWTSENGGEPQQGDCDGAEVAFTNSLPEVLDDGEAFSVRYKATIPSELMPKADGVLASVHACDRSIGFCTPFVDAESSEELQGTLDGTDVSFESRVSYSAGQYTLIAVVQWEDMMGAVHYMARARQVNIEEPLSPFVYGLIAMGAAIALLLLGVGSYLALKVYTKWKKLRDVAKRSYRERVERVLHAYGQTRRLAYPMVCISYHNFKAQGKMITHEFARTNKMLYFFDTVDQILLIENEKQIVFISHQWTGKGVPDPTGVQFRTIVKAIDGIAEAKSLDPSKLLVWIDYTSIPQRSRALQTLSIASLPVYATFASHFLVVAPEVKDVSDRRFSLGTYKVRGWCRLEQWARLAQRSVENMWICDGSGGDSGDPAYPASNDATFTSTAMRVFHGDFTVDHDRFKLIDVLVGLYAMLMERTEGGATSTSMRELVREVRANSKIVYPTEYFEDLLDIAVKLGKEGAFKALDQEHHSMHMESIKPLIQGHALKHAAAKFSPRNSKASSRRGGGGSGGSAGKAGGNPNEVRSC